MDIYDPGLMGADGRVGTSAPSTNDAETPKTELDQNVEKLVGNISSWWSGIAKKSQDSLDQARKEVQTRGGIVNYAKAEYARLESSIGEAQKKARDQSQAGPEPESQDAADAQQSAESTAPSETSKGKQRAMDDATVPQEGGAEQGPTLGASISTLFSKLTADPRLVSLQHSLTSTLQGVTSGQRDAEGGPAKVQESLSKLSATIQSHLPHLDLKESQQLATRYLHATENFAREMQADMKDLVGDLVRIVPPETENATNTPAAEAAEKSPVTAAPAAPVRSVEADTAKPPAPAQDDEDFAWDEDDEEAAADASPPKPNTATATATRTPSASAAAAATAQESKPSSPPTKAAADAPDQSDEDSDWE